MSDKAALSANDAIDMMENISTKLREAIIKSMPCAFEQYLTISIPGQVIDTTDGGSFVSETSKKMTVDRLEEVRVNESRLVDAMVPLDKVMLGPTGKSVSRSYYTALDTLVPRKTDIGSTDIDLDAKPNKDTRYGQALDFLRSSVEMSQNGIPEKKVKGAKKKMKQMGKSESLVEVYVAKQLAWAQARAKLDEARSRAGDARLSRADQQGSAEHSERKKNIRNAQAETHARWMDWVVNGDKFRVDYAFEQEATRDSMILAIDGTEWAAVTLEPKNCFKDGKQDGLAPLQKEVADCQETVTKLNKDLNEAKAKVDEAKPKTKETVDGIKTKLIAANDKLTKAQEELKEKGGKHKSDEEKADQDLQESTKEPYELEKNVSLARKKVADDDPTDKTSSKKELEAALTKLEQGKDKWIEQRRVLQAAQSRRAMAEMEMSGRENMSKSVMGHLSRLDEQIADIEALLDRSGVLAQGLPSAIALSDSGLSGSDAWTKIAFTVEAKSESTSTSERATSASIDFKADGWFASVHADSSVSSASKKVQKDLSECTVDGSFSAILVTIRRPWLHADLFQDFDIDTPDDVKLSPGAAKIKTWIERGDGGSVSEKLADYGKFPAYPTSFIVAADTVLEFKSNESKSEELMSHLSTDSSIKANYGPWGLSRGASLKTDNKDSSMKMEVRGGALRISFQAPQIIGWVSEILPQLPRQKGKIGDLSGPPNRLFRL
ncbi:hypothetical protein BHE90_008072 [Fusarium euwallaceae]|uniref:Uncharacterized protein n=1 Tax=Fusarium euwallaceae TaxID=1147111 RepID=A0A430LP27_9HYPO|nr:hypothetical protein BHE90_008072 [Fusarium euwallaceae]